MIVDVNVLLSYVDVDARFHCAATRWLDHALNGEIRVGIPWHSVMGFLRICTNPRAYPEPLGIDEAMEYVDGWLAASNVWIPAPGPQHGQIMHRLLADADGAAGLVPDAHLEFASPCLAEGIAA